MNTQDAIAAFLAKGGKINKVETGANSGISARDFYKATQGVVTRGNAHVMRVDENALIEQRHVATVDHMGRSFIVNGLGELIGVE